MPQRRWSWISGQLADLGHDVLVVAPPPHYNRRLSFSEYLNSLVQQRKETEFGPDGEVIWRCGYLPADRSLTYRALNQGVVAVSTVATCLLNRTEDGFQPDLVIGTVPALPTAAATYIVSKMLHIPYIVDLRDAWPELLDYSAAWNDGTGKRSLREKVLRKGPLQVVSFVTRRVLNFTYRHSSAMILTSEYLRQKLDKDMARQAHVPELVTIRNVFPPRVRQLAATDRVNKQLHVLYAGTLGRAQQLSNAVEAVKIARGRGYDVHMRLVGAGATSAQLRNEAKHAGATVKVFGRADASEIYDHYQWADTALVHLADWEPLKAAVPSKTFELIQLGIHISGAIAGETADIIRGLGAGDVVPPNDPVALADLWCELIDDPSRTDVGPGPAQAIRQEAEKKVPFTLYQVLREVAGTDNA